MQLLLSPGLEITWWEDAVLGLTYLAAVYAPWELQFIVMVDGVCEGGYCEVESWTGWTKRHGGVVEMRR